MKRKPVQKAPEQGDLAPSSIFEAERKTQEREKTAAASSSSDAASEPEMVTIGNLKRNTADMATVLDPAPRARERWQRKMVIREIQRGGRLSEKQFIKRTERELLHKSQNFKTSIKKLGPLARQIQGKTIDEAIAQMRFSKKKAARYVTETLEYARDKAIVSRGMGLGGVKSVDELDEEANGTTAQISGQPMRIELKDGKKRDITDKTQIYVDQAYVGRGPFGTLPDFRARGQINFMQTPWTHLSVKLKEEATRVREHEEREEKRRREKLGRVWVHLPDRPIQGQRQWFSW